MLALQIGFTLRPHYKPYRNIARERNIMTLVDSEQYEAAIDSCNALMRTNPLSLTAHLYKAMSYDQLGRDSTAHFINRYLALSGSCLESGMASREQPLFVLSPIDGQHIVRQNLGATIVSMGSGESPEGYFLDIIEMTAEGYEAMEAHFNIDHATKRMFDE